MKWWDWMPWSSFSQCWALSQLFHSPLSLSSRGLQTHIYGILKDGNDNPVYKTAKETQMYRSLLDSVGEGDGGMIWENCMETWIISYKKWITSLSSMQDTGCLGLVCWDDPERWYGEGGRRGVQDRKLMYTRGRFMLMYGKTNTVL